MNILLITTCLLLLLSGVGHNKANAQKGLRGAQRHTTAGQVYTAKQLLDEETWKAVFTEHETGRVIVDGLEGTITEAGGKNGNDVYVRITKNTSGVTDGNLGVGKTAVITLKPVASAYSYMGAARAHAIKALMVKGRKIAFSVLMEGNQPFLSFAKIAAR